MAVTRYAFDKKSARSYDADGRLRVKDCVLSTAEINLYPGDQIPGAADLGLAPSKVYELFRDPEELRKAVASFEGVPLMVKHVGQTADEPRKDYVCGSVHNVTFDGKYLRGDLLVWDGYAIGLIDSEELDDLSCGYRYEPDMAAGSHNGSKFDGVMRAIAGNHVALVDDGRASGAHVADSAQGVRVNPQRQQERQPVDPENEAGATGGGTNDMAQIGAALKQMTVLLQQVLAKVGGGEQTAAPPAGATDENGCKPGKLAEDEDEAGKLAEDEDEAGKLAEDEGGDMTAALNSGKQDGTGARGAKTMAMDANSVNAIVAAAVKTERKRGAALEEAKRDVAHVLGPVYGMDSAGEVYRAALKQVGVDVKAIPAGAERGAWGVYKSATASAGGVRPPGGGAVLAMDSAAGDANRSGLSAHINRIAVK